MERLPKSLRHAACGDIPMADEPDNTKADGAVIQRLVRYTSISEQPGRELVAPAGCP